MKDDILTYREMCDLEDVQTLQRGMNYRLGSNHSVILMSQPANAPYNDRILDDGLTILYEGHDIPKTPGIGDSKKLDQPSTTKTGRLTQNGKFVEAVKRLQTEGEVEKVHVYEKLFNGVWSFRGMFDLVDYTFEKSRGRRVFVFALQLSDESSTGEERTLRERSRIIPTEVKKQVWVRDGGKCVMCGASDELHFDHDIPYSKGGSSITAENVKILCARHNLSKSDKIQ